MKKVHPRVAEELKTLGFLVLVVIVFSVLFILGHLVFYQDWPRWK